MSGTSPLIHHSPFLDSTPPSLHAQSPPFPNSQFLLYLPLLQFSIPQHPLLSIPPPLHILLLSHHLLLPIPPFKIPLSQEPPRQHLPHIRPPNLQTVPPHPLKHHRQEPNRARGKLAPLIPLASVPAHKPVGAHHPGHPRKHPPKSPKWSSSWPSAQTPAESPKRSPSWPPSRIGLVQAPARSGSAATASLTSTDDNKPRR